MDKETIEYYNKNAKEYLEATLNAPISSIQNEFLSYIPKRGYILDAGCGSGRDSFYFIKRGFKVLSMDASIEMCKATSILTGQKAKKCSFDDISYKNKFNGIWACASLLHVQKEKQQLVWSKIINALKSNGFFYCSYKKGDFFGYREGRYYSDMNLDDLIELAYKSPEIEIIKAWETKHVRPENSTLWVNIIVRKLENL